MLMNTMDEFYNAVNRYFDFLVNDYGYKKHNESERNLLTVSYTSAKVIINIYYGAPEWRSEIAFGLLNKAERNVRFNLGDLI